MAAWLSIIIGLATALVLIAASIWCVFRAGRPDKKTVPPSVRNSRRVPSAAANIDRAGSDDA